MSRIALRVFMLVLIFSTSAWAGERVLTPESFNRYKRVYAKIDGKENLWTAYQDLSGAIHIKNISEERDLIVNEGRETFTEGMAFDLQGENAFVVWVEKIDGRKRLYFRATHDSGRSLSEPILIDDNSTRAFSRLKLGSNLKGDVFILWYGDTTIGSDRYHFYSVTSNDSGRTFSGIQNLTAGYNFSIYPTLLVDEENAYIFSYSKKDSERYMIFRKTSDGGRTWNEPVEIKKIGVVTLFIEPVRVGKRLHVFWLNGYDGETVVEGAFSDDGGTTWSSTSFDDTRGLEISSLSAAHDSKGGIYLTLYASDLLNKKKRVYVISSQNNGEMWEKMTSLRHYPFETTHAERPAIYAAEGGEVVVVWVDYRNIRSNLYMQYSKDYGKTWQQKDIPLEEPGRYNSALFPYLSEPIIKKGDRYYLLAHRFKSDLNLEKADLLLMDFTLDDGGKK